MKTRALSILRTIRESLNGSEQSYTTGSINRAILLLSVPMVLEMLMESLFAVVDVFFVSKLGVDAVATVGLTESVLTIIYSVAIGLSAGATAMVARRIGEKDVRGAANSGVQAIYLAIGMGLMVGVAGLYFAEDLLGLMGLSPTAISSGINYTRWMLGGNLTVMLLFLINAIFRGAGDASLAMRSLWIANILNIILDPIFIFGLGPIHAFGVEGAAIATNIGRGVGVAVQLYYLFRGPGIVKIKRSDMILRWNIIKKLVGLSIGGAGQFMIASASWIFLIRIIAQFGSTALAGYTIGIRIIIFAILPSWGMSNAAATLVGQNLGAGQPDRAETSVWRTAFYNMVFLGSLSVIFMIAARPIVGIFTSDTEVTEIAVMCLRIVSIGYVFFAYGMVISQSFNGAGDTRTPTILNIVGFWMIQIPLAYLLAVVWEKGPLGVFIAITVAESLLAILGIVIFRRGKWKTTKV